MLDHSDLDPPTMEDMARPELTNDNPGGQARSVRPPRTGYGSNVLGDTEVHLIDYVKVLYRRRWIALSAFLIVVLSVSVYTFTATPIYEARVQILIEKEATNVVTFKEAIEQNQNTDDYYQ